MADDQPDVDFAFGENTPQRKFRSLEEFERWFTSERAKWEWLRSDGPNPGNVANNVASQFNEIRGVIEQAKAQTDPLRWAAPQIEARWSAGGYLRYSDGQVGAAILDARQGRWRRSSRLRICLPDSSSECVQCLEH